MVSIIIPSFDYGHYLPDALSSVLSQSCSDWECIVIDDGSTDNTEDVVTSFIRLDNRFKYIRQLNKGMSAARNTGLQVAAGEYIQFLDADDLLEEKKLEIHARFLDMNPDVDVVYGDARYFPSGQPQRRLLAIDGKGKSPIKKVTGAGAFILQYLLVDNIFVMSCPMLRKEVVAVCGVFDESLKGCEDWEYWLRCVRGGIKFAYAEGDLALSLIRFHPGSVSKSRDRMLTANISIRRKLQGTLIDARLESINDNGLANAEIALAVEAIRQGKKSVGFLELTRLCLANFKFGQLLQGYKVLLCGR